MWGMPGAMRQQQPATPLISFKAGKMRTTPSGQKFRVEADERRGLVQLERGTDGAIHLLWKDRQTLQVVDDLLVFPGDQTFEKVDTGRPDDRVYLLAFKTTGSAAPRRLFFWMQDPDGTQDESRIKDANRLMNEPAARGPIPSRGAGAGAAGAALAGLIPPSAASAPAVGLDELSSILNDLGYSHDSAPAPLVPAQSSTEQAAKPGGDSSMDVESSSDQPSSSDKPEDKEKDDEAKKVTAELTEDDLIRALEGPTMTPNLARIVNGDALQALLDECDEEERNVLLSLLPEGRQTMEELRLTFRTPQLRQTLVQLSKALNSENINMVIANFGLDPMAGAHLLAIGDGIGAFLAAIEADAEREQHDRTAKQ